MRITSNVRILVADFFALKSLLRPSTLSASTTRFLRTLPHGIQTSSNAIRRQGSGFHAFDAILILLVSLGKEDALLHAYSRFTYQWHVRMVFSTLLNLTGLDLNRTVMEVILGFRYFFGLIECGDELESQGANDPSWILHTR